MIRIMTRVARRSALCLPVFAGAVLAGCATQQSAPMKIAGPVVTEPRPVLPDGVTKQLAIPSTDASGRYRTINYGLTPDQQTWHVRSALNVAVLSCRGPDEAVLAADYNAMLKRQKTELAASYGKVQAAFRLSEGPDWQSVQDAHATRVYNFFALPPAKPGFCAAATELLAQSRTIEPAAFHTFASEALLRLESPFINVYQAYDGYRRALAAWEARQPGNAPVQMAAVTPNVVVRTLPSAASPVVKRKAVTVEPRLDYAGLDTLADWEPAPVRRNERLASAR